MKVSLSQNFHEVVCLIKSAVSFLFYLFSCKTNIETNWGMGRAKGMFVFAGTAP